MFKKQARKLFNDIPTSIVSKIDSFKDRGLFGYISPLIYEISSLTIKQDPSQNFDEVSQKYLFSLIENAPSFIGYLDLNFNFLMASHSFNEIVKDTYRIKEPNYCLIGKNLQDVFPKIPEEIHESLADNLAGKNSKHELIEIYHPYRERAWIGWESFPWYNQSGMIQGIIIFCEDVTSTHELFLSHRKLYSRAELLENFSLIFSHDLIQPLRQISTYASFLEMELEGFEENKAVKDNLDSLNRCIAKAKEICEGVILYCKNGDLTINKEAVSSSEVIDMTIKCCAINPDIHIKDLTDPKLLLYANKPCLLQLFQNLIDNAIKHSSSSPIEITLSGKPLENNYYEFSIHNNGWCPKSIEQSRIFDAFYSDNSNGSGLGLMICKKIITAHGGDIQFISSPEDGTRISFSLPLYRYDDGAEG